MGSLQDHYTIDDTWYNEIKEFNKELVNFEESIIKKGEGPKNILIVENLLTSAKNSFELVEDLVKNVNQIVVNGEVDPIDLDYFNTP